MFFPFNLKLGAQLTTYAGVFLAATAALAWVREDAVRDTKVAIQLEFERSNSELKAEVARRVQKVETLQRILEATEKEAAGLLARNNELLEKQRETIPLSEACSSCRIPNERLWLRVKPKGTPASAKGSGSS